MVCCCALLALTGGSHAAEPEPLANGVLLVAKPELQDPNFRQTVVLITQPEPGGGPIGVIINRSTERRLRHLFPNNPALQAQDDRVYFGGPVQRTVLLFAFRASGPPADSLRVLDDVYLSGNTELLEQLLGQSDPPRDLRVYAGYAGWAPGQLQAEIALGGWFVIQAEPEIIFSADPAGVWEALIRRLAGRRAQGLPGTQSELVQATP